MKDVKVWRYIDLSILSLMSSVFILQRINKNSLHRIPLKSHLEEFEVSYCSWIISWFGTRRSLPRRGLWLWWSVCVTLVCKCQQWSMVCQCVSVSVLSCHHLGREWATPESGRYISTFAYLITSGRDVTASSRLMPTYCTQTTHGWREREAGRGRSQGDLKIII